jgi:FkbM family methyltransferase
MPKIVKVALLKLRSSRLGEAVISLADFDVRRRLPHVPFPVYLQLTKNLSEQFRGGAESAERANFRRLVNSSNARVLWDIGANVGQYSWEFIGGADGRRAVLFEPDQRNVRTISKTIKRNGLTNCFVVEAAAAASEGESTFYLDRISGKQGSVRPTSPIAKAMSRPQVEVRVRTITLDGALSGHPAPDVLKVDVEGAEEAVVQGAAAVLRDARPLLMIEIAQENYAGLAPLLSGAGYRLFDAKSLAPSVFSSFLHIGLHREQHAALIPI